MAAKKNSKNAEGLAFIIAALKKSRSATYAEIRDAAAKKRLPVYPIMFGRAQHLLGIVKTKKQGASKRGAKKGSRTATRRTGRGPGRPRKAPEGLDSLVAMVRAQTAQQEGMRRALEKIRAVVSSALA